MKKLILIGIIIAVSACKKKDVSVYKDIMLKSYVMAYYEPTEMWLEVVEDELEIRFKVESLEDSYTFLSSGKYYEKYLELSEHYGDLSYNKSIRKAGTPEHEEELSDISGYDPQHNALYYKPVEIIITSDKDFDENHKAGTPLNDIVTLEYRNIYSFIKNGYPSSEDREEIEYSKALLSELDFESKELMFNGWNFNARLSFTTQPTLSFKHNITVYMKSEDGIEFYDIRTMKFTN